MKEQKTNIGHFIGIPDVISLLNLTSGFLSIIFAINNNTLYIISLDIFPAVADVYAMTGSTVETAALHIVDGLVAGW